MAATAAVRNQSQALPSHLAEGLKRSQLPALDGIRAIAAFLVVISHAGYAWVPAGLGVLAFFVLSGFLITWLLLKEDAKYGEVSLRLFYARRALRIFPAFYVYWALVVGSRLLLDRPLIWTQAIASFFYVTNYYQAINGDPNTSLSHTWSLGIEEQFYFLWPLTFLLLRKTPVDFLSREEARQALNPDVALDHMLVDTAAMRLVTSPASLDVVVTENMFGDILTDEASVLAGSMGMLPSASIGAGGPGLYEPIHGSAPDIAGKGIANPIGTILSAAMLLRHTLGLEAEAATIEKAVDQTITEGARTADLGGKLSTTQMADEILKRLQ